MYLQLSAILTKIFFLLTPDCHDLSHCLRKSIAFNWLETKFMRFHNGSLHICSSKRDRNSKFSDKELRTIVDVVYHVLFSTAK